MNPRDYTRIGRRLALALLAAAPIFAQCPTGTLYPGALDTNASLTVAKNNIITTLTVNQQITDTVAIVASTTGWVANMMAAVDTGASIEYEFVTSISGQNTLNVSRACEGSAAVVHLAGAPVDNNATAYSGHTALTSAVTAVETLIKAVPTAHSIPVAEGTSPFTYAAPGTTGQVLSSTGASSDPTFQTITAGNILPAGTQTQFLRIAPNTGNNTTLTFGNRPYVSVTDYNFGPGAVTAAYSCNVSLTCAPSGTNGGSLVIGNNTLTMTPVPQGVNGNDAGHYFYISGGTGAAEACLITGGGGTQGQTSGAIIINCANTHSGAWTIQSATAGIQEAIVFGTAGNTEQEVYIPAGTYQLYQQITIPNLVAPKVRGGGKDATFLIQNTPAASILVDTCNCEGVTLSDFQYTYATAANSGVNAIVISGGNAGSNQHAQVFNLLCNGFNGSAGFVYNCLQLFNVQYAHVENGNVFQFFANYGVYLTGNNNGNGGGDNHVINNTFFAATTSAASLFSDFGMSGILFALNKVNHGVNGFSINIPAASFGGLIQLIGNSFENSTTANINIFTASTSSPPLFDIEITDNTIDIVSGNPSTWSGVLINGTSVAGNITGLRIQNNRFAGYTPRTTTLAGIQFAGSGTLVDTALISGNEFSVLDYPMFISSASTNISFIKNQTSNQVVNQNQIGTAGVILDLIQPVLFGALNTANQLGAAANGSRLYCSDCNAFGTAGSSTGQHMIRENGVWVPSNTLIPMAYNTNANATGAITITAAQITGGSIEVDLGLTGNQAAPQNATLPTVAALLAVITNAQANQTYKIRIINVNTTQTATITTNTGWTLNGTMTIATNTWRDFVVTITSVGGATATLQAVGTGTTS